MTPRDGTDRLQRWVHWSLLCGAALSGLLLAWGLFLNGHSVRLTEAPAEPGPVHLTALLHGVANGDAVSLMDLGLLLLITTPILRVAVLGLGWLIHGDGRFAAVALVVLAMLVLSLMLGIG